MGSKVGERLFGDDDRRLVLLIVGEQVGYAGRQLDIAGGNKRQQKTIWV
jgi:hypothetical protein